MIIIETELKKWKRNKTIWSIFILTILLGLFADERAFDISRSSPYMNSFGDLYTLAFKNLSSLFLPIVLGILATTIFYEEQKNDTQKQLMIIPISKEQYFFSKVFVLFLYSMELCLITWVLTIAGGLIAGGFHDLNVWTSAQALFLFALGGILIPLSMFPIIFLTTISKGYVMPIAATMLYLVPVVAAPSALMGVHPVASAIGIYSRTSIPAMEMVKNWVGGGDVMVTPLKCLISLILSGIIFAAVSVISLKKQTY